MEGSVFRKEIVMRKFKLLLLAAVLTGTALLSAAKPAAARCVPYMCWNADENTVCCWEADCSLWCG
jgi:hypothetical protein